MAQRVDTEGASALGALSPSRVSDFRTCALRYRFRTVDRLPEAPTPGAFRGSVVHKVLEELFDLPALERTVERAASLLPHAWEVVRTADPTAAEVVPAADSPDVGEALESCRLVLERYFDLEDPRLLEPAEREAYVETLLDSGLLLRGIIDRLDVAADGAVRVVDYKTGRAPAPGLEATSLFQLRFYALVLWRSRGVLPAMLRLVYLGDGTTVSYVPDEHDLRATERVLLAVGDAIALAHRTGEWLPHGGSHCRWCSFRAQCPEFGGVPPPLPVLADRAEPA